MGTKSSFKHYIFLLFIVSGLLLASCGSSDEAAEQKMDAPTNESVEKKADEEELDVESPKDDFIAHDLFEEPMQLMFSSGAGAWSTIIELSSDGSFTGIYKDANAGESGNGYVSTTYISEFTGQFGAIQQLDAETYEMKLVTLDYQDEDTEWIEDNTKYITAEPYGFEEGKDFFLYSPKKNIESLNDDLLSWGSGHGGYDSPLNELQYWVLHNEVTDYGFFSEKYANEQETE